jgi:hypothetical protein
VGRGIFIRYQIKIKLVDETVKENNMEFITKDSRLYIEGSIIKQRRIIETNKSYILAYAFMFLYIISQLTGEMGKIGKDGIKPDWFHIVLYGGFCLVFALWFGYGFYVFLIRRTWKSKISISEIRIIKITPGEEGLETEAKLIFMNGRYKSYIFRTLENQVNGFTEALKSINPAIQLIIDQEEVA